MVTSIRFVESRHRLIRVDVYSHIRCIFIDVKSDDAVYNSILRHRIDAQWMLAEYSHITIFSFL